METRADEPPDLLDDDWRREDEAYVDGDDQLGDDAARRVQVNGGPRDPRPMDQILDHPARHEEGSDSGQGPRGERDDERPAQGLEVLDDRHTLLLGRIGRARGTPKDPV